MNLETVISELDFEIKIQKSVIERNPQGLVILDYQTRRELWTEQVVPDRRESVAREPTYDYGHRMATLLFADYFRLQKRADKESKVFDGILMIGEVLSEIIEYRRLINGAN